MGFPDFFYDEGVYLRRALHVLEGQGPEESGTYFDHPYFGQIFLAFIFKIIGYPDSLNPKPGDVHSIEMLYLVPRVLMGLLAVVDTFLVYKISDRMYGRKVAFIASIFFAVMPMTWILRRILLDSIQLPFLLSSIFFALYYTERPTSIINNKGTKFDIDDSNNKYNKIPVVVLSGIFLGLAIFTKIPVFMMIPLVAYLIYKNSTSIDKKGKLKTLGLWFIPVILIPAIWPAYNMLYGNFDDWQGGILWQVTERLEKPLFEAIYILLQIDPVLLVMATAGIGFSVIMRRGLFLLLWIVPFLIFLGWVGFVSFFHLIPLMPAFCISAATLVVGLSDRLIPGRKRESEIQKKMDTYVNNREIQEKNQIHGFVHANGADVNFKTDSIFFNFLPYGITLVIGIFGIVCTTMLITTSISYAPYQATAFVADYLSNAQNMNNNAEHTNGMTVISNPIFSWIFENVFDLNYTYLSAGEANKVSNIDEATIVADSNFKQLIGEYTSDDMPNSLKAVYDDSRIISSYEGVSPANNYRGYPYTSMRQNFWTDSVEIRIKR